MTYLYGDSTESDLTSNYLGFLQAALAACTKILKIDEKVDEIAVVAETQRGRADQELAELTHFGERLSAVLLPPESAAERAAGRASVQIQNHASDIIRRQAADIKNHLTEVLGALAEQSHRERLGHVRALETLLLEHDLPLSKHQFRIEWDRPAQAYNCKLHLVSELGMSWQVNLDVPSDSALASPVKVEKLSSGFEIKVPEMGGIFRKGMRMKALKMGNLFLTELVQTASVFATKWRVYGDEESGLDITVAGDMEPVQLTRVAKSKADNAFEAEESDVENILHLCRKVQEISQPIATKRVGVREILFDGRALQEHERPSEFVVRLVSEMAPVVQEIIRRSLQPEELVLKRVLADNRREEIFVSKDQLRSKLEPLNPGQRTLFIPLGLFDEANRPDKIPTAETRRVSGPFPRTGPVGGSVPPPVPPGRSSPITAPPPMAATTGQGPTGVQEDSLAEAIHNLQNKQKSE